MPKSSDEFLRQSFGERNGIPSDTPLSSRPVSGYLVHPDNPMGVGSGPNELEAQGDIEVILRKDVASRTSYTRGDTMKTGGRLVPLTSTNSEDITDAISNADGKKAVSAVADSVLGLLQAEASKRFDSLQKSVRTDPSGKRKESTELIEAQILGGFEIDDVEGISYPYEKVLRESQSEGITDILISIDIDSIMKSAGLSPDEMTQLKSKFNMGIPETPAFNELKAYRRANSLRKKFLRTGIEYVVFPRADGKNIDDPRTYDKSANAWDDIEEVLVNRAKREIQPVLVKEMKNMRKPQTMKAEKK